MFVGAFHVFVLFCRCDNERCPGFVLHSVHLALSGGGHHLHAAGRPLLSGLHRHHTAKPHVPQLGELRTGHQISGIHPEAFRACSDTGLFIEFNKTCTLTQSMLSFYRLLVFLTSHHTSRIPVGISCN